MRIRPLAQFASLLLAVSAAKFSAALAQEAPQPVCKTGRCSVIVDWGTQPTPTFVDRRYGSPGEFEQRVAKPLVDAGYRVDTNPGADGFRIRLRPDLVSAMCDRVPGTSPDMSCRTIGEVRVDFLNADPAWKLPGALRIRNRCGSDERMDIEKFSAYAAALLDYTLARDESRKRPNARC